MIKLNNSGILFNKEPRYYYEVGKTYQGITRMIGNRLFPNQYANIPSHVMQKAQDRGNRIHADLTTYDVLGIARSEEAEWWAEIIKKEGLTIYANEYIVSDFEHFASPIDKVGTMKGDKPDEVILIDVKATYKLFEENVRWQLSIYKVYFEKLNPHLKVKGIYCLHVKYGARLHKVEPIAEELVNQLTEAEIKNYTYANPLSPIETQTDNAVEFAKKINSLEQVIEELEKEKTYYDKSLKRILKEVGKDEWETDRFIAIFETGNPELKGMYKKEEIWKS